MNHLSLNLKPATHWMDASPVGNGRMGALVYGKPTREIILMNDERWYHGGTIKKLPRVSKHLPKVRAMIERGNCKAADCYFPTLIRAKMALNPCAYAPTGRITFICGIDLIIEDRPGGLFSDYRRELDFSTGVSTVRWQEDGAEKVRTTFVSRRDDVSVTRITSGHELNLKIYWAKHSPNDFNQHRADDTHLKIKSSFHRETGTAHFHTSDADYGGVFRVITDGAVTPTTDGITVTGAREVMLLSSLFWGKDASGEEARLAGIQLPFAELLSRHTALHTPLYNSVAFSLESKEDSRANEELLLHPYGGDDFKALIERLFNFGRYLLICSSSGTGLPANLQGVWNGDYEPAWGCHFFNNENIQLYYHVAMPGGLMETMEPFFRLYEGLMDDFRENALRIFGAEGIVLPLYNNPNSGLKRDLQPHCIYWTGGGAWIARFFYDYYEYTGDVDFLRSRAVPFMEEVYKFYRSFAVIENGEIKITPSVSPENTTGGAWTSVNAVMDIALLKEVCRNLIASYRTLGQTEKIAEVENFLAIAPDYRINAEGALAEWIDPRFADNYKHRHLSHLYPVFPGDEIDAQREPELFQAAAVALKKRMKLGLKDQTGWSLAHAANIFARFGDGENALISLKHIIRYLTGENLFTYSNDWHGIGVADFADWVDRSPYQLDANCGFSAGVIEMLVFSRPGYVRVLPALPSEWQHGEITGVRLKGNGKIDLHWDMERREIKIDLTFSAEHDTVVQFPFKVREIRSGNTVIAADTDRATAGKEAHWTVLI